MSTDTAESIAKVVSEVKKGRVADRFNFNRVGNWGDADRGAAVAGLRTERLLQVMRGATVVDATMIYEDLVTRDKGVMIYEDHIVCPVWEQAFICYRNEHGNVMAMHTHALDLTKKKHDPNLYWESEQNPIDWSEIRWIYHVFVYIGGYDGNGAAMPTTGPVHMWRIAVKPNGEMQDINWIHIAEGYPMELWDMAQLVVLGAINLGNCVNVQIVEPNRPRAVRRRIERTGETVSVIHLRPISKSYKGMKVPIQDLVPLHSVRGHFAEYGINGRGLLFGKYSGRFWIPAHARGSADRGTVDQRYVIDGVAKDSETLIG